MKISKKYETDIKFSNLVDKLHNTLITKTYTIEELINSAVYAGIMYNMNKIKIKHPNDLTQTDSLYVDSVKLFFEKEI